MNELIKELREWWEQIEQSGGIFPHHKGRFMGILSHHETDKAEPKDCGYTLATCPYEMCSGITISKEELDAFRKWKNDKAEAKKHKGRG